jgi:RNA polymerase sigma factor (sigma-70 family)
MKVANSGVVCSSEDLARRDMILTVLFREHHDRIISYFRRRHRDQEEASDLTQEVFLRLSKCDPAILLAHPRAMTYRVARCVLLDAYRSKASRSRAGVGVALEDADLEIRDDRPSAEQYLVWRDQIAQALLSIEDLPRNGGEVVFLSRFHQMTNREIAERKRSRSRA